MTYDPATLAELLTLDGPAGVPVRRAIAVAPTIRLDTAGASTLTIVCEDPDHELPDQVAGLTAAAGGLTWSLAALKRRPEAVTLTLEDQVAARLRTVDGPLSVPAGSTTVNELATRLAVEAGLDTSTELLLEPTRQTITSAFTRPGTSWASLDRLAVETGRWRYSDGTRLVLASPAWLLTQPAPSIREDRAGVGPIEYTIHAGKEYDVAAAVIDDTIPTPGQVHNLEDLGPASGLWLVASFTTVLGEESGRVTWLRPRSMSWS